MKNGKEEDVTRDLVVLYRPFGVNPPRVSDARKAWKKRHDNSYEYKRALKGYTDFKVP